MTRTARDRAGVGRRRLVAAGSAGGLLLLALGLGGCGRKPLGLEPPPPDPPPAPRAGAAAAAADGGPA